ncbi:hypothetical protein D8B26_008112 [Coccidioides posadasii str. Silveira]|uniref:Zinc metallopeptidase n=2 Tax=Coccidioides posadasii TaxID=199306 RepID=E9DDX2_COCPS|nr:Zn-finger in Ran binding protein and others domain containing protein [Coccidioides posadasii C735 delta SOWgp]EER29406.1 Zn-finger in Ran binding protein and others domain containing protein [Coccidioides posadasii C735 delta SOWgp]EFW15326.1 zinc metallopeptidase [Coccidioides posadasii str. Silveira]QVM13504.1 hypothetical protein D8B26_008112 [Coccidioides posadasii str. Silveira]|eukprot:XP_003071551.1 Zn-finger in Ran binding protein and others domain containing protein [Coccidioides posadasii C735 delta SOWgp]
MREFDALVSEYQHDKRKPKEAEALTTLRKVASLVKPIMRQRSWRVGTLCEFYPAQANLLGLNINHGEKICLRLRSPHDEKQFIPLEQIVDTMLHELCHIVHGPHNQEFHALWNQLRDEHEQLVRKGYTGEGFLSAGHRLGGKRVPPDELRRQARAAAEKRRVLTAGSGQRLGGMPPSRGADMRKVIADAAERRKKVTEGCASGTKEGQKLADEVSHNGFRTKAEEDDANERAIMEAYIELIQQEEREQYGSLYVPPSAANPAGPRALAPPPVPESTKPRLTTTSEQTTEGDIDIWPCPVCTLVNPSMFLCCDACGSERPQVVNPSPPQKPPRPSQKHSFPEERQSAGSNSSTKPRRSAVDSLREIDDRMAKKPLGWVCHMCGTFMESEWWTCACCGTMKQSS